MTLKALESLRDLALREHKQLSPNYVTGCIRWLTVAGCDCGAEQHNAKVRALVAELELMVPVEAIECGIECIQMFKEKELLDAAKHRRHGRVMSEVSCEHAAQSLQKHIEALAALLPAEAQ
jgi:hypothetical protein